ncbi:MAG: MBOAT family protein [Geobacter sp.]|nr:MBOAT family protein [Geobacter sp.]
MSFSAPIFLFLFLPLTLAGYFVSASRFKVPFLLAASLFFYIWSEGERSIILVLLVIGNYLLAEAIRQHRDSSTGNRYLALAVIFNIGILAGFKYGDVVKHLLLPNVHPSAQLGQVLPLGLSFLVFQALAYLIDISQGVTEPERSLTRFALFMTMFPKITAGPIIRYGEVADDLASPRPDLTRFTEGVKRFIIGLGKKVLVADTLAQVSDQVFSIPGQELTSCIAWLGIVCYTLQIYFDFSGYSDMAIGLGRIFGFRFAENFNYPYVARSLREFWQRWHISLSSWLRDYLFTPLNYALVTDGIRRRLERGQKPMLIIATLSSFLTFTVCGIWHGTGWHNLVWGGLHGLLLGFEGLWWGKVLKKLWSPLQHCYLIAILILTWVVFRAPSLQTALYYLQALAGFPPGTGLNYNVFMYLNKTLLATLCFGMVAVTPITPTISAYLVRSRFSFLATASEFACLCGIMAGSIITVSTTTFMPFIYRQF